MPSFEEAGYGFELSESSDGRVSAELLGTGGSVTDEIDYPNERDWFAVTLVAGTTYRIDLEGQSNGAGTLYDPYLHGVYDSHGDLIGDTTADDGGSGRNSRVLFTATEGGIHYVSAGADGSGTGTYRLSVTDVDAQTAGTDTSGTVSVGGSVTEEIDYADERDWFAVTLVTGTTYRIDLEGTPTGAGGHPGGRHDLSRRSGGNVDRRRHPGRSVSSRDLRLARQPDRQQRRTTTTACT